MSNKNRDKTPAEIPTQKTPHTSPPLKDLLRLVKIIPLTQKKMSLQGIKIKIININSNGYIRIC